jgi:plastocyanin
MKLFPMHTTALRVIVAVAVVALVSACGRSDGGPTGTPQSVIQKAPSASGDGQTGTVGAAPANPLRVMVTLSGVPQPGTTVIWAADGTGASLGSPTAVTDASGIATSTWTLGRAAGSQSATATLAGATGSPVTFSAMATAAAAARVINWSDNQSGAPNTPLTNPLKVWVTDQFGNGVSGVRVAWQVTDGTASVNPTGSNTDASGIAQTSVTLGGTSGPVTITATSNGLTGSPFTLNATISTFATTATVRVDDDVFVSMADGSQNPAVDTIAVNGIVTWTWVGEENHSVRSNFANSAMMNTGSYSFKFTATGTYTYDCSVHPWMTGIVVVK